MKAKILFLSLIAILSKSTQAQTLTCASTCPQAGQVYTMRTASPVIGASGQNKLWDFSNTYLPSTAPKIYAYSAASVQASYTMYPQSNLHLLADGWAYFLILKDSGIYAARPISAIPQTDALTLPFPFSYGSAHIDTTNSKFLSGTDTVYSTTIKSILGTGTGTVVLPNGKTYSNVLQVKTLTRASAIKNALPFGYSYTVTAYTYYQVGIAQPLATYSQLIDTSTNDYAPETLVLEDVFLGMNALSQTDINFEVVPNPTTEKLTISKTTENKITIYLYSAIGELVLKQELSSSATTLDVSALPRGIYVLKSQHGSTMVSKKIVLE